ncbi:MAG: hypothetical protein ACYC6Y_21720, partial [Thermoguttaceae bacterium]
SLRPPALPAGSSLWPPALPPRQPPVAAPPCRSRPSGADHLNSSGSSHWPAALPPRPLTTCDASL